MKKLALLLLLVSAGVVLAGDPLALKVPGVKGEVKVAPPDHWTHELKESGPRNPPSLQLYNGEGKEVSLQITALPAPGAVSQGDAEALGRLVEELSSKQYEEGSVEKKTKVEELKVKDGVARYALYTDADLASVEKPEEGQYKKVTTGMIRSGAVLVIFTLLSQDTTSDAYKAAMKFLAESVTTTGTTAAPGGGEPAAPPKKRKLD